MLLRDGKKVIGTLRSFDQFANIVLEEAVERIVVGKQYADVPLGLYVIRGENTVLIGAIVRRRRRHHRRRNAPPPPPPPPAPPTPQRAASPPHAADAPRRRR